MPPRQARDADPVEATPAGGRTAQRRRTRAALIDATTSLIATGSTPSVDDIAAAADVSRRTVYMHFPTLDQLVLDATAGALSRAVVDAAIERAAGRGDAVERVSALAAAVARSAPTTLALGRKIIALTVDAPERSVGESPRRGYRRVQWIEQALEPLRDRLPHDAFERLVSGLAVVVGWEAMVVLRDVRGLDADREEETMRWAAVALVREALRDDGST